MNIFNITIPVLIISYLIFRLFFSRNFVMNREISDIKKKILDKQQPDNIDELKVYEIVIDKFRHLRPIKAWGTYLMFKYLSSNYNSNKDILFRAIAMGEELLADFSDYSFYEDALFMLGNIYFFDIYDFDNAIKVYRHLVNERSNTRWRSICLDRIELISSGMDDDEALRLYVSAEKYFEESKFEEAEFYLKEVINRFSETYVAACATYFLGDIYYYKYNDLDKAVKYYRATEAKYSQHPLAENSMYKVGEILRKMKQWEDAIQIYKDYINRYKNSLYKDDAYYYIGESFQHLGRLREAKNAFNLILGDYPNSKWTDVIYHKVQDINKILRGVSEE